MLEQLENSSATSEIKDFREHLVEVLSRAKCCRVTPLTSTQEREAGVKVGGSLAYTIMYSRKNKVRLATEFILFAWAY